MTVHLADVDASHVARGEHVGGALDVLRNAEHACEIVASAARDDPKRNLGAGEHAADLADQPVAAHHHRDLTVARGLARLVDRVLERLGPHGAVRDASPLERALELRAAS